jgi:hypothetical protein
MDRAIDRVHHLCYTFLKKEEEVFLVPAKNPRINVVLDTPLYRNVQFLAQRDHVSLSTKVRDLLKEAVEVQEDIYLASMAEERERSMDVAKTLTHDEVWS